MRRLFKLKTILTIVLLIIAICTQVANVLGAENDSEQSDNDVMPLTIGPDDVNVWWLGDKDYNYEYSSCAKNMVVPDYSDLVKGYNYYITDFYGFDISNKHKTIEYKKTLIVSDQNFSVLNKDSTFLIIPINSYNIYLKSYELTYSYSLDNEKKVCTLISDEANGKWVEMGGMNGNVYRYYDLATLKKHVKSNQDIYYNDSLIISKDSVNLPEANGNYYTYLENSANEIHEIGWKDKEYVSMGGMPNYQYIHIRKQLNVMKDEYFQFLFSGSFYGIDDKSKIMNVSIQLFDEEGNASEMIPVEYSFSKEKGLIIKQKVSKSPINATQIELVLSLKDEYTSGAYGHLISEFDIASDSTGETNSWLGGIFDSITKLPELIIEGLSSLLQGIIDAVVGLGTFIVDGIVAVLNLIIDGLKALGTFIIDGLKALFIPSDDFFSQYFSDLYDFFSEKLGILIFPFELLIYLLNCFLNIGGGSGIIHIPNVDIVHIGHIFNATSINLKEMISNALGSYYDLYFMFVDCIIVLLIVNYAKKKFNDVVGGNTDDN